MGRMIVFLGVVAGCTYALPLHASGTTELRTTVLNATCLKEGYSCARCMNPCCCTGLVCDKSGPPKCEKPSSSFQLKTAEAVAGTVQMDEECYKILEADKCWADKACKWGRYGCVLK